MHTFDRLNSRRRFLTSILGGTAAAALSALYLPGAFAEELIRTPEQTEGPFYPTRLPLDTDNDLIVVNHGVTPAVGTIAHLTGRVLDAKGEPLRNAVVEIWQCDNSGVYHNMRGSDNDSRTDKNFQGYGRFLTASTGEYYFRTIKPVAYPGRTPHIHMKVKVKNKEVLTTQCYIKGHAQNQRDGVLRGIRDQRARDSVQVDFTAIKDSKIDEVAARFEIRLGFTPEA